MDKSFLRALFWALLVFMVWQIIALRIWPQATPSPSPASGDGATPAEVAGQDTNGEQAPHETSDGAKQADVVASAPAGAFHAEKVDAESVTLGSTNGFKESPYRMEMRLSNSGASVETVELSDHRQTIKEKKRYTFLSPITSDGEEWRSLAVEQVTIDNHTVSLDGPVWRLRKYDTDDGEAAEFTATVLRGDTPALELVRTIALPRQPIAEKRHDVHVSLTLRNLTDEAMTVIIQQRGAVGVASAGSFTPDQKVFAAVRSEGYVKLSREMFKKISKGDWVKLYRYEANANEPLQWYGTGNLYFTCTVRPVGDDGTSDADWVAEVEGNDLDESSTTADDVTTRMTTRSLALEGGASRTLSAQMYIGPKDRDAFANSGNEDYVQLDYMLQIKDGYGSCTFNFLTDAMIRLLNWLESICGNFGVAIIFLVIVVRVLLHPITKKTQVNMVKMQSGMGELQPKMEAIKKKFAGDAARIQQETMKLYREEGINPLSQMFGCLPMFLQMPIWIALYSSLRNNVAMRGRGFVWWIDDLTAPDDLYHFSPPLFGKIEVFHLLPILVGVMMFAQQKLMPKPRKPQSSSSSSQAQQAEQMQKMMPYMSLMMIFLFYKFPSGLNLYIMASSLFGAIEQWRIRKHIKARENEPPAPKVARPKAPRKGPSLFEKLQQKAEEAQKLRSQRDRGKGHK